MSFDRHGDADLPVSGCSRGPGISTGPARASVQRQGGQHPIPGSSPESETRPGSHPPLPEAPTSEIPPPPTVEPTITCPTKQDDDSMKDTRRKEHDSPPRDAQTAIHQDLEGTGSSTENAAPSPSQPLADSTGLIDAALDCIERDANSESAAGNSRPATADHHNPDYSAPIVEEESDVEVTSYMNELFQRLRNVESTPATALFDVADGESPAGTSASVSNRDEPPEMLKETEFKPKAVAPERNSDMGALRALANENARMAVAFSRNRQLKSKSLVQTSLFAAAATTAGVLFALSAEAGDGYFFGSVASALVAVFAGIEYLISVFSRRPH